MDDHSGTPRALIRISELNGLLQATIEKGLRPQDRADDVCRKCSGALRNRPLIGMVIVNGLHRQGEYFGGGDILDPDSGSLYRCRMRLSADGKTLEVRGYLGFSLLGRTQTWYRMQ